MLRMRSFDAALVALVLSALLVILLAVLIGMVATSAPGLAQNGEEAPAGGGQSWAVAASGEEADGVWKAAKEGVLAGLESLRAEVHVLAVLSALQGRLLEWNQVRLESGLEPSSLEAGLCEQEELQVWCELLPATFGRLEADE